MAHRKKALPYKYGAIERVCGMLLFGTGWVASLTMMFEAAAAGDFVYLIVSLGFCGLFSFLLLLAITYRNLTAAQIEEFQRRPLDLPGQPPVTPDDPHWIIAAAGCRAFGKTSWRVVAVDLAAGQIHFKDSLVPKGFWGGWKAAPYARCALQDVLSAPLVPNVDHPGGDLHIVTTIGKAVLPDQAANYKPLRELLQSLVKMTPSARPVDSPFLPYGVIFGTLVGIAVAAWAPLEVGRKSEWLGLLLGGCVGGISALGVAYLRGRWQSRAH